MSAVSCGHEAIARLLIGLGAVVDQANSSGRTPLHYAVSWTIRTSTTPAIAGNVCLFCWQCMVTPTCAHSSSIICSPCILCPHAGQQGRRRHHPPAATIWRQSEPQGQHGQHAPAPSRFCRQGRRSHRAAGGGRGTHRGGRQARAGEPSGSWGEICIKLRRQRQTPGRCCCKGAGSTEAGGAGGTAEHKLVPKARWARSCQCLTQAQPGRRVYMLLCCTRMYLQGASFSGTCTLRDVFAPTFEHCTCLSLLDWSCRRLCSSRLSLAAVRLRSTS